MPIPMQSPTHHWAILFVLLFNFQIVTQVISHIDYVNHLQAQAPRDKQLSSQLDKSVWQIVDTTDRDSLLSMEIEPEIRDEKESRAHNSTRPLARIESKPIDWDDDDLNGDNHNHLNRVTDSNSVRDLSYSMLVGGDSKLHRSGSKRISSNYRGLNKLVFHGHVDRNGTTKVVDGIKLHIDTHAPLTISRRSHSSPQVPSAFTSFDSMGRSAWSSSDLDATNELKQSDASLQRDKSGQSSELRSGSEWRPISAVVLPMRVRRVGKTGGTSSRELTSDRRKDKSTLGMIKQQSLNEHSLQMDFKWKPIASLLGEAINLQTNSSVIKQTHLPAAKLLSDDKLIKKAAPLIVYGRKVVDVEAQRSSNHLTEPFDDDDLIASARSASATLKSGSKPIKLEQPQQQKADSLLAKSSTDGNKWRPLDLVTNSTIALTTTASSEDSSSNQIITTQTPMVSTMFSSSRTSSLNKSGTNSSSFAGAEQAQRSASDLNYIYSSQPQVGQSLSGSSSYYSNYLMPSGQQQTSLVDQTVGPVIDTVSGSLPEAIADRIPESPALVQADVSVPSIQGSVQVPPVQGSVQIPSIQGSVQVPPIQGSVQLPTISGAPRPPSYGSAYDHSAYISYQQPQRLQQLPQYSAAFNQQQPTRQATPTQAPQVVRQEHHYHYYNQQQRQQPTENSNSQFDRSQSVGSSGNHNQQTVIREIQPLLISQPIVQAPSSTTTTPAPQIIREIVKEVPVQTMQVQPVQVSRIILPQATTMTVGQPPIPLPSVQTLREIDASPIQLAYAPAQRIIRTISNSIPQVAVRMPALPQIRFPVPTLPLPVRLSSGPMMAAVAANQAPVTRQTGSFIIPSMPKKTTTFLTETQAMPTHTTIMQTTQFTPATRTTVYTTDHQTDSRAIAATASAGYKRRK